MSESNLKPLHWTEDPNVGLKVSRRSDGGMNVVFSDVSPATLNGWREFALEHLIDSDQLTRNLYDLRQIESLPEMAIKYAVEVNNDPSVRNIRMAIVVGNDDVRSAIHEIKALTTPGGVEMEIFEEMDDAEDWLAQPLTKIV